MKLLEEISRRRAKFLQRDIRPNLLLCPLAQKHELLGELLGEIFKVYAPEARFHGVMHVMGLRIIFSEQASAIEVAATLE